MHTALETAIADLEQTTKLLNDGGQSGAARSLDPESQERRRGALAEALTKAGAALKGIFDDLVKSTNPGAKDEEKGSGSGAAPTGGGKDKDRSGEADSGKEMPASGKSHDAPPTGDGKKKKAADLPEEEGHGGDEETDEDQYETDDEPEHPDKGKKQLGKGGDDEPGVELLSKAEMQAMLDGAIGKPFADLEAKVTALAETFAAVMAPLALAQSEILKSFGRAAAAPKLPSPGVIGKVEPKGGGKIKKAGDSDQDDKEMTRPAVLERLVKAVQDGKLSPTILSRYDARGNAALDGIDESVAEEYALPVPGTEGK